MSLCVQYSRPASGQNNSEIFGFDVAVTNLMTAWFSYSRSDQFICRPTDNESFEHFKTLAASVGIDPHKCIGIDPRHPEKNLQSISCIFRPDPLTVDLMWRRPQVKGHGYATCGLVHTMSGERIARAVGDLYLAPSDTTDALICPSTSVRDAVRALWDIRADYLHHRFGAQFSCPVQTPVIPLGINTEQFIKKTTPEKRKEQRKVLSVDEDEIVILFVGRLSFATKAHPMALFRAAERAAGRTGKKTRLVMLGYFKPKDMEPHFRTLAQDICKTIKVDFIMNDDARFPDGFWAGADIFVSLSDNVQESFGLTPLEAMASGLPAIISDWDGYREGVRNNQDGYLIPTTTPPASAGMAIANFYYNEENYGNTLTGISQSTSVDIECCAHALEVLMTDASLRLTFGKNAQKRARDVFDWRHIIRSYEDLWQSLSEQRIKTTSVSGVPVNWQAAHPAFPNPLEMFKSFPTTQLLPTDILHIVASPEDVQMTMRHGMNYFVPELLVVQEQMLELIALIRNAGSVKIGTLLATFPLEAQDLLWRCIGWLIKFGICSFERPISV
jgi:glycosyltransferase involved in cell wall biosynthesis